MATPITLRPVTPADLPALINILIAAFAPGPWSTLLFPPHLRTCVSNHNNNSDDEFNWRLRVTAAQLGNAGHTHVVATTTTTTTTAGPGQQEQEILLGWAHWVDAAAATAATTADGTTTSKDLTPAEQTAATMERVVGKTQAQSLGLDTAALSRMREEGAVVEHLVRTALGEARWATALELHYLMVDPSHQRKGVGQLLTRELLDRAAAEGRAVWLRSTLAGRPLYLALGFEEVGEGTVCGERQFGMVKWGARLSE